MKTPGKIDSQIKQLSHVYQSKSKIPLLIEEWLNRPWALMLQSKI